MKKYIREILTDLNLTAQPKAPEPPVAEDLDNQTLSKDPAQRVRQLEWQAQKSEERQQSS
jgi:hypothetical protein